MYMASLPKAVLAYLNLSRVIQGLHVHFEHTEQNGQHCCDDLQDELVAKEREQPVQVCPVSSGLAVKDESHRSHSIVLEKDTRHKSSDVLMLSCVFHFTTYILGECLVYFIKCFNYLNTRGHAGTDQNTTAFLYHRLHY